MSLGCSSRSRRTTCCAGQNRSCSDLGTSISQQSTRFMAIRTYVLIVFDPSAHEIHNLKSQLPSQCGCNAYNEGHVKSLSRTRLNGGKKKARMILWMLKFNPSQSTLSFVEHQLRKGKYFPGVIASQKQKQLSAFEPYAEMLDTSAMKTLSAANSETLPCEHEHETDTLSLTIWRRL